MKPKTKRKLRKRKNTTTGKEKLVRTIVSFRSDEGNIPIDGILNLMQQRMNNKTRRNPDEIRTVKIHLP